MEERQEPQTHLSPKVIRQGFSNQLKELTLLNTHSPRIFIVYAHSLDGQEETEDPAAFIAKQIQGYLQPTILAPCPSRDKHLNLNVYSAFSPQGNGSDSPDECKRTDVLYRQLGLLPKHTHSVDYVVVYGSHNLEEYCEIKEVKEYTSSLRRMLSAELSKSAPDFHELYTKVESALHVLKSRYSTEKQQFHSLYTELALLTLRTEERYKGPLQPNDVITLLIDRNSVTGCPPMLQDNSFYMGTVAGLEKGPKKFYIGIFDLLRRLFGKLGACQAAIDKAHSAFTTNTDPALWTAEDARELEEKHGAHEEGKTARQRIRAKNSFFALSASSEEELVTEVLPKSVSKTATTVTVRDTAKITEVLRVTYQQDCYAKLPRLFSEETAAIADTFVNVAILKEEVVKEKESKLDTPQGQEDKQRDTKEIQDNRLQSHERLYEVHETIAIGALFASPSDTRSPRKLLLYGRAGIGKTVLCRYIVSQWAEKSDNVTCFRKFQAVFWIPLRELMDTLNERRENGSPFKREMLVAEMVAACCLRDSDWQEKTKKQQLHLWLKSNAESTLFILDGYDEIAETAATPCILSDCLNAVLNETQYKPYVMLTSRPVAIDSRYSFDRRLECMGFIDENIPVFVSRYIRALPQSNDCLTFLKKHPSIWGTAHVPIHLELICWLWSRGELSLRSEQCLTMAELYTKIVEKIERANYGKYVLLKETCLYTCYDKESPTKNTITYFANDFLSFLSFHAMQQEGVLLPGEKIKDWAQEFIRKSKVLQADKTKFDSKRLLTACLHLGLLKSTRQGGKDLFDHTYYFIHLSFQEFFAAKYYQQAFEHSDTEVIKHFQTHKYTPSYQLTWWMTAGLLYQQGNYASLRDFFEALCTPPLDLIGIHHANLLSHCLDECQADETVEVVAQLTQHLAGCLQNIVERYWLSNTWGKTLLQCSNLLHAKSFQDIGLNLFEKYHQFECISSNTVALLLHLATQEAIGCLTNQALSEDFRAALVGALSQRSDLTAEQVQSLFGCLTDTTIAGRVRVRLIKVLAQRSDLTAEQVQSLFDCLTDTTIAGRVRVRLIKALAQRSDLIAEQVQSLIACATDTALGEESCTGLIKALAQRSDLTAEQVQSLFDCATYRTRDREVYERLAKAFIRHSDLTTKQEQSLSLCERYTTLDDAAHKRVGEALVACVTTRLDDWVHVRLAEALAQRSDLPAEQVQSLIACVTNTRLDGWVRGLIAKALSQRSSLPAEQVQSLFACVTDTTIDVTSRIGLAEALSQRSSLPAEQVQSLIACVTDTRLDGRIRVRLAEALAQRSDLTAEQVQSLFACVTDTTIDSASRLEPAKALVQRSDLTAGQVQSLFACVTDTRFRVSLAKALAQSSNLTAEQVQFLIVCVTDTTIDDWDRIELAEALAQRFGLPAEQVQFLIACVTDTRLDGGAQRLAKALFQGSDLTTEQVQSLIACIRDTRLDGWVRVGLAQALVGRSGLPAEQVQSLFVCVTDTTIDIDGCVRVGLAEALAQRPDLTAEQVQSLIACVTDTRLDGRVRVRLAQVLIQRSDLTAEQVQSLFVCVTNTRLGGRVRGGFAEALAKRFDLTAEQVQFLFACVINIRIDSRVRVGLVQALAKRSDLTAEQVQSLFARLTDTTIADGDCEVLAEALAQRFDLTAGQIEYLFACVANMRLNTRLGGRVRVGIAQALAQRYCLPAEQVQPLFACLRNDAGIDVSFREELAKVLVQHSDLTGQQVRSLITWPGLWRINMGVVKALVQRSDLTAEQMQSLFACLPDRMHIFDLDRIELAEALVQRSDLTVEQIQSLFACVTSFSIDDAEGLCKSLLAQYSNFNVQQLQQGLVYCLKNEIICERYPSFVFSILQTYYCKNQIEQHTVLPSLSIFLTRPSTWFALAEQQALFLYDKANGIALLRLGTQTMKIPLRLNHSIFFGLSHKVWGKNLHSIGIEQAKTCTLS